MINLMQRILIVLALAAAPQATLASAAGANVDPSFTGWLANAAKGYAPTSIQSLLSGGIRGILGQSIRGIFWLGGKAAGGFAAGIWSNPAVRKGTYFFCGYYVVSHIARSAYLRARRVSVPSKAPTFYIVPERQAVDPSGLDRVRYQAVLDAINESFADDREFFHAMKEWEEFLAAVDSAHPKPIPKSWRRAEITRALAACNPELIARISGGEDAAAAA